MTQTEEDRAILRFHWHPDGPQFIGPRSVRCHHYDDHHQLFYRTPDGRWHCPRFDREGKHEDR